jgi:hypothetical protein
VNDVSIGQNYIGKRGHFYIRNSQTLDFARQLLAERPGTRFCHDWRNDCQSTTAIYHKYSKLDRSNTGENIDAKLAQVCRLPDVASAKGAAHGKQLTQSA